MFDKVTKSIRVLSAASVEKANSGHPGMPMGMAEVGTVLFGNILNISNKNPDWINRDRFVLSAGHGSMLLYSLLHFNGMIFQWMTSKHLDNLIQTQQVILK